MRTLDLVEADLDELQRRYLDEEDDKKQMEIELRFSLLLDEATEVDGKLRRGAGVNIQNWTIMDEE